MFSEKLNKLLESRGITAYKLSKDLDIPQSLISRWRNGTKTPSAENLAKLSEYFGVSINYLLDVDISPVDDKIVANDEHEKDILVMFRAKGLSESDKAIIKENIKNTIDIFLKAKGLK